jgi:dihydrofolate synthase/folylpolyglutamate synthase
MQAVRRGLIELDLPGRFQVLAGPAGNHSRCGTQSTGGGGLADNLAELPFFARTIAVVGMLADKDIAGSLAPLAGMVDTWLLADLDVPRGASAAVLATAVRRWPRWPRRMLCSP